VLYMGAEDPQSEVRLRAEACGADLERFRYLDLAAMDHPFSLSANPDDQDRITATLIATIDATGARVIVLDPIQQFMAGLDSDSNGVQVRQLLSPLVRACRASGCTGIIAHHTNKQPGGATTPQARVSGSQAYLSTVRLAMLVDVHSDDSELVCMDVIKSNLGPRPPMLGFRFEQVELAPHNDERIWKARPVWEAVEGDAMALGQRAGGKPDKAVQECADWLEQHMPPGTSSSWQTVSQGLVKDGKNWGKTTVFKARKLLGIEVDEASKTWVWGRF